MRTRTAFPPAAIALVAAAAACVACAAACAAEPPPPANAWVFACDADNDLYRAVAAAGAEYEADPQVAMVFTGQRAFRH